MSDDSPEKPGVKETNEAIRRRPLNVLVAGSDVGKRNNVIEALIRNGVPQENIEWAESAGPTAFKMDKRVNEGEKRRIHLLILDGRLGGEQFSKFISESMGSKLCPLISDVVSTEEQELTDEINRLLTDTEHHIVGQLQEEAVREDGLRRGKLPQLEGRGYNLIHDVRDQLIWALDADGTTVHEFLMERFLKELCANSEFMDLIKNHSVNNRQASIIIEQIEKKEQDKRLDIETKLMEQLENNPDKNPFEAFGGYKSFLIHLVLEMFETVRKNKKNNPEKDPYDEFGEYEKFIELTPFYCALAWEGLPFDKMLKFGEAFVEKDIKAGNVYPHTKPLINMYQKVGLIVTLITGAPREVIEPLRRHLNIREICHALEFDIDENGNYTGEVKYNSGLPRVKAKVIRRMQKAGHRIVGACGDSISADGEMITPAVFTTPGVADDIYGGGLFFGETPKAIADAKNRFANEISTGRLKIIHRGDLASEAIVDEGRYQLFQIINMPDNKDRIPNDVVGKIQAEMGIESPQKSQLDLPLGQSDHDDRED